MSLLAHSHPHWRCIKTTFWIFGVIYSQLKNKIALNLQPLVFNCLILLVLSKLLLAFPKISVNKLDPMVILVHGGRGQHRVESHVGPTPMMVQVWVVTMVMVLLLLRLLWQHWRMAAGAAASITGYHLATTIHGLLLMVLGRCHRDDTCACGR